MEKHLETQKALQEIGVIEPWFSEEDGLYVFEHPAYPAVVYGHKNKEKAIQGYKKALEEFIEDRLSGNVADFVEAMTSGRGGKRDGAGRPVGTKKAAKKRIYLETDVADWLNSNPQNVEAVRQKLMHA